MPRLLIVEDNEEFASDLKGYLQSEGHWVELATTRAQAQEFMSGEQYDLIILDWELPDGSGSELCKLFREQGGTVPILMLTGKARPDDKERGLDSGADDYMIKPFVPKELSARLRALLRRADRPYSGNVLTCADLALDPLNLWVKRAGKSISLVPKEFAILEFLLRNKNKVFSVDDLISHVWRAEEEVSADTVRTHIKNLRKKINPSDLRPLIDTVHGAGYRLGDN